MAVITQPLSQICCGKPDSLLKNILMNGGCFTIIPCWCYFCRLNGPKLSAGTASASTLVILVASAGPTAIVDVHLVLGSPKQGAAFTMDPTSAE